MKSEKCLGEHNIFVAEVVGVEAAGKIIVVTVCRNCDAVSFHEHQALEGAGSLRLMKEEKGNGTL